MKRALLVLGLLGCKKSTMMPAIPGATVERFVTAMKAVCADVKLGPTVPDPNNPIAAANIRMPCTPDHNWTAIDQTGGAVQLLTLGALIQLDADGAPNRMELMVLLRPNETNGFAHVFLGAYGVPLSTFEKIKGHRDLVLHEPDYRILISRNRAAGMAEELLTITIDNQPGDD